VRVGAKNKKQLEGWLVGGVGVGEEGGGTVPIRPWTAFSSR